MKACIERDMSDMTVVFRCASCGVHKMPEDDFFAQMRARGYDDRHLPFLLAAHRCAAPAIGRVSGMLQ
jgi:hypothetical protein